MQMEQLLNILSESADEREDLSPNTPELTENLLDELEKKSLTNFIERRSLLNAEKMIIWSNWLNQVIF